MTKSVFYLVALTLSGCVIGDPIESIEIKILFLQTDERGAIDQFVSSVEQLGYKKGGQWVAEDKTYYDYNKRCNWSPECIGQFRKIAKWVEASERKTSEGVSFWLDKIEADGTISYEPHVDVRTFGKDTSIAVVFEELGSLPKWEKDGYREMTRMLVAQYGEERIIAKGGP